MNNILPQMTVGRIAAEHLGGPRLFQGLGIDYCCGGKQTLADACALKKLDLNLVLSQIKDADRVPEPDTRNWDTASLTDLANHIESSHHAWLKQALPFLSATVAKVERAHGSRNPNLQKLRIIFEEFRADLEQHMATEELFLFPMCRELEADANPLHCRTGALMPPIDRLIAEHENAGEAMEQMRALTEGYTAPVWACASYRAMISQLKLLETDMHQHVHLENNILFPKAAAADVYSTHPEGTEE